MGKIFQHSFNIVSVPSKLELMLALFDFQVEDGDEVEVIRRVDFTIGSEDGNSKTTIRCFVEYCHRPEPRDWIDSVNKENWTIGGKFRNPYREDGEENNFNFPDLEISDITYEAIFNLNGVGTFSFGW